MSCVFLSSYCLHSRWATNLIANSAIHHNLELFTDNQYCSNEAATLAYKLNWIIQWNYRVRYTKQFIPTSLSMLWDRNIAQLKIFFPFIDVLCLFFCSYTSCFYSFLQCLLQGFTIFTNLVENGYVIHASLKFTFIHYLQLRTSMGLILFI